VIGFDFNLNMKKNINLKTIFGDGKLFLEKKLVVPNSAFVVKY